MKGRNLYGNWHRSREYRLVRARLAVLQRCSAVRNQRNGSNRNCANVQERGTSPEPILPKPCHPKPIETGLCHYEYCVTVEVAGTQCVVMRDERHEPGSEIKVIEKKTYQDGEWIETTYK